MKTLFDIAVWIIRIIVAPILFIGGVLLFVGILIYQLLNLASVEVHKKDCPNSFLKSNEED